MNGDLISRKALVKELIAERDKHTGEVDGEHRRYNQAVRAGIHKALRAAEEAPAVDTVPVVYCCACKYFETDAGFCRYWESGTRCDDFCSRSAKMDEEEQND